MDRTRLIRHFLCLAVLAIAASPAVSQAKNLRRAPTKRHQAATFDASHAWEDLVKQVDMGPRVPGSDAQIQCRDWMAAELKKSCDDVKLQEFSHRWTVNNRVLKMWNVIGFQNWKDAKTRVVLIAHWDSRAEADQESDPARAKKPIPAANDGASCVAILLELARVMHKTHPDIGIQYFLTDGEDLGPSEAEMYLGSIEYANHQPSPKADYGILLDMLGKKRLRVPMEPYSVQFAPRLEYALYRLAAQLGLGETFPMVEGPAIDDDHLPINKAGLPTIDLIDFDYMPYWHTLNDTPDKCSPESLGKVGKLLQAWLEKKPAFDIKH